MRIQYMMLCEHIRRGQRGLYDALGILDRIYANRLPAVHTNVGVAVLVIAESEDDLGAHDYKLSYAGPSGQKIFEQHGTMRFEPKGGAWFSGNRINLQVQNLPIPEFGKYWFEFEMGGLTARHPLDVVEGAPSGDS